MAVNKVVYNTENGAVTLMDLTGDSVTADTLAVGTTAHDARGEQIVGTMPRPVVENWTFTLEDGSTVVKAVYVG